MSSSDEVVTLKLTPEEALVLFDFLSRFSDSGTLRIEDQAEQRALWNVCCLLERQLVQPLRDDYAAVLARARAELRDRGSEPTG